MKHLFTYTEHINEQARLFTKLLPKIEPWMVKNLKPAYNAFKKEVGEVASKVGKVFSGKLSIKDWENIWDDLRKVNDDFDYLHHRSAQEGSFYVSSHAFYLHPETGMLVHNEKLSGFRDNPLESKEIVQKQIVDKIKKAIEEADMSLKVYFETKGDDYSVIISDL